MTEIVRRLAALEELSRRPRAEVGVAACRVYRSIAQSLTNATPAALAFDQERYDDAAFHSTSANNTRMTIPATGRYTVGGAASFASNATGYRQLFLYLNGTTIIAAVTVGANPGASTDLVLAGVDWAFTAGDYVELWAFQNSGGALNVQQAAAYTPEYWIHAC